MSPRLYFDLKIQVQMVVFQKNKKDSLAAVEEWFLKQSKDHQKRITSSSTFLAHKSHASSLFAQDKTKEECFIIMKQILSSKLDASTSVTSSKASISL